MNNLLVLTLWEVVFTEMPARGTRVKKISSKSRMCPTTPSTPTPTHAEWQTAVLVIPIRWKGKPVSESCFCSLVPMNCMNSKCGDAPRSSARCSSNFKQPSLALVDASQLTESNSTYLSPQIVDYFYLSWIITVGHGWDKLMLCLVVPVCVRYLYSLFVPVLTYFFIFYLFLYILST